MPTLVATRAVYGNSRKTTCATHASVSSAGVSGIVFVAQNFSKDDFYIESNGCESTLRG